MQTPNPDPLWASEPVIDPEVQQSHSIDGWMLTYLDVFVQLTAIFVVLFLATQKPDSHPEPIPLPMAASIPVTLEPTEPLEVPTADTLPDRTPSLTPWQKAITEDVNRLQVENVEITLKGNMARINITNDVLFGTADAQLQMGGRRLLQALVPMIMRAEGSVMIEGHTDNRPIRNRQFASNWELGAARASEVLHFLAGEGVGEYRLRAISYGATEPVAPNDTDANRQINRRVSIVLKQEDFQG